mmetsp:Transcript_77758/g.207727  ORF Transcript_77758/g.207727 Transcript_77758/m.207727 type:complete len:231 (-) Transcript_77758:279-971(-)
MPLSSCNSQRSVLRGSKRNGVDVSSFLEGVRTCLNVAKRGRPEKSCSADLAPQLILSLEGLVLLHALVADPVMHFRFGRECPRHAGIQRSYLPLNGSVALHNGSSCAQGGAVPRHTGDACSQVALDCRCSLDLLIQGRDDARTFGALGANHFSAQPAMMLPLQYSSSHPPAQLVPAALATSVVVLHHPLGLPDTLRQHRVHDHGWMDMLGCKAEQLVHVTVFSNPLCGGL